MHLLASCDNRQFMLVDLLLCTEAELVIPRARVVVNSHNAIMVLLHCEGGKIIVPTWYMCCNRT